MAITPTPASQPVIKNDLADIFTVFTGNADILDLLNFFDDPSTTGQGARFQFYNPERLAGGIIDVILFDQADTGAPTTVNNFLNYVNNNSYNDSFIHRAPDRGDGGSFVVQGGVFNVTGDILNVGEIITNPPIVNDYSTLRENIVGTIAMAKRDGEPNSATSSWFFNVNDNTQILNDVAQGDTGGFTTFGQVINDSSLAVVNAIDAVSTFTGDLDGSQGTVRLTDVPLFINSLDEFDSLEDYVRLVDVQQIQLPELTFSASSSNPSLVDVSVDGQQLAVNYLSNSTGTADITVQATNVFGQIIEQSFSVNVESNEALSLLDTTFNRFSNRQVQGTFLFATEAESVSIRQDFGDVFSEDGPAFKVATTPNDDLIQFNRFANLEVPGTYLFATEGESESIRSDFGDVFREEGIAFYAYGADADVGVDYYRLANTQVNGTYLFVNQQERDSALAQFPGLFRDEGVAFEVAPV